jgi:hypothetical protein
VPGLFRTFPLTEANPLPQPPMKIPKRQFLRHTTVLTAAANLPVSVAPAAAAAKSYAYLGRTEDYAEFQIIEPGLVISKVESCTHDAHGIVRVTTRDGREGYVHDPTHRAGTRTARPYLYPADREVRAQDRPL